MPVLRFTMSARAVLPGPVVIASHVSRICRVSSDVGFSNTDTASIARFTRDISAEVTVWPGGVAARDSTASTALVTGKVATSTAGPNTRFAAVVAAGHCGFGLGATPTAIANMQALSGAALDVFNTEPLPADHPYWQESRITVTPHISALTLREDSIAQIANKIRLLAQGQPIAGVVDLQRGY